jgi:RNA polymerase sigma-70 factor (ECF subfamily)
LRAASFANLDTDRIGSFLTATALRLCIDQYRERERQYRLRSRLAFPDGDPTPEETICERLLGRWLLAEVKQLPHRERQVMLARASGLSTAEAAVRHNISVKAAESAFTRGRSRLREVFEAGFQLSSRQRPEDDAGGRARPRNTSS